MRGLEFDDWPSFVSKSTLKLIDESRVAIMNGNPEARKLRRLALRSPLADKKTHVRSIFDRIEKHLLVVILGRLTRECNHCVPRFGSASLQAANYWWSGLR